FKFRGEESRILLGHFPETSLSAARGEAQRLRELSDQGIDPRRAHSRRRDRPAALPLSPAPTRPSDTHSIDFLVSEFITPPKCGAHTRVWHPTAA
ncbi:MAG: Arm DNA-binding domain-containing protein, partial [Steroidobacteraceae bacterium]